MGLAENQVESGTHGNAREGPMNWQNEKLEETAAIQDMQDKEQLGQGCQFCLAQCEQLLEILDREAYVCASEVSSIGAHVRHIVERFQSFLNGLGERVIDYDCRKRDRTLENNLQSARFALTTIARRISELRLAEIAGQELAIRESVHPQLAPVEASSTVERELVSLISHSIHHLAIIAMLARPLGYTLGSDFGKAPSTIIHEKG